jgi:hypothetical protein
MSRALAIATPDLPIRYREDETGVRVHFFQSVPTRGLGKLHSDPRFLVGRQGRDCWGCAVATTRGSDFAWELPRVRRLRPCGNWAVGAGVPQRNGYDQNVRTAGMCNLFFCN